MNILDNFKIILCRFLTFGVRRSIDVLDSENQPTGLQGTSDTKSMKTKKNDLRVIKNIHSIEL